MVTFGMLRRMAKKVPAEKMEELVGPFVLFERGSRGDFAPVGQFHQTVRLRQVRADTLSLELKEEDAGALGRVRIDGTFEVGRLRECDVRVSDPSVSKHHARITWRPDGSCVVEDLASTNGTYVNDLKVGSGAFPLGDAQVVRFGDSEFLFFRTRALYAAL